MQHFTRREMILSLALTALAMPGCSRDPSEAPRNEKEFFDLRSQLLKAGMSTLESKFTKIDAPLVIVITDNHQLAEQSMDKADALTKVAPAGVIGLEGISFNIKDEASLARVSGKIKAILGADIDLFQAENSFKAASQHAHAVATPHVGIENEETTIKTRLISSTIKSLEVLPQMIAPVGEFLPLYDADKKALLDSRMMTVLENMVQYSKNNLPAYPDGVDLKMTSFTDANGTVFHGINKVDFVRLTKFLFEAQIGLVDNRNKDMVNNLTAEMTRGAHQIAYLVVGFGHAKDDLHPGLAKYTAIQKYLEDSGVNYIVLDNPEAQKQTK